MPQIEVRTPQGQRRYELPSTGLTIGRADDNQLVIHDDLLSRRHCVIEVHAGDFRIRDLKSRNGTKINRKPLADQASPLVNGDIIRIGSTEITYIDLDAPLSLSEVPAEAIREPAEQPRHTLDLDVREMKIKKSGKPKTNDWERQLNEMIKIGEDRIYTEAQISLVDNRGDIVHRAVDERAFLGSDKEDADGTRAFREDALRGASHTGHRPSYRASSPDLRGQDAGRWNDGLRRGVLCRASSVASLAS